MTTIDLKYLLAIGLPLLIILCVIMFMIGRQSGKKYVYRMMSGGQIEYTTQGDKIDDRFTKDIDARKRSPYGDILDHSGDAPSASNYRAQHGIVTRLQLDDDDDDDDDPRDVWHAEYGRIDTRDNTRDPLADAHAELAKRDAARAHSIANSKPPVTSIPDGWRPTGWGQNPYLS